MRQDVPGFKNEAQKSVVSSAASSHFVASVYRAWSGYGGYGTKQRKYIAPKCRGIITCKSNQNQRYYWWKRCIETKQAEQERIKGKKHKSKETVKKGSRAKRSRKKQRSKNTWWHRKIEVERHRDRQAWKAKTMEKQKAEKSREEQRSRKAEKQGEKQNGRKARSMKAQNREAKKVQNLPRKNKTYIIPRNLMNFIGVRQSRSRGSKKQGGGSKKQGRESKKHGGESKKQGRGSKKQRQGVKEKQGRGSEK